MAPRGLIPRLLVAPLLSLLAPATAADDPCECLNWKQVYATKRVLCGEGYEFAFDFPYGRMKSYEEAYFAPVIMGFTFHEFCGSFFHRMDNNYCVNILHHTYDAEKLLQRQWCYVSKKCQTLDGGVMIEDKISIPELPNWLLGATTYQFAKQFWWASTIPRDVSIKLCTKERDTLLGEMSPMAVMQLGKSMDSVTGFVTKTAFPMARRGDARSPTWDEVKGAIAEGNISKLPDIVRKAVVDKRPIIIDIDPEGHTHQRILVGKDIYELDNICDQFGCGGDKWPFRRAAKSMGEL